MSGAPLIDRLIRRDQWIVGACLALAAALAWLWLLGHAGAGGSMDMDVMGAPKKMAPVPYYAGALVMWSLMMTAMMLPSAAPMMLLYARFSRGVKAQGGVLAPTAVFVGVYLVVWGTFGAGAAAVQTGLVQAGLAGAARLAIGNGRTAGLLLILFGLYQLTPLKRACLDACRSPFSFLTRFWRPGLAGAVRLGLVHGLYCVGCCWLMMALLFVVGVMNLAWVGLIAVVVLVEKTAPLGGRIGMGVGAGAIMVGAFALAGGRLPL